MTSLKQAEAAINAILDSIPDSALPKGKMQNSDGQPVLWFENLSSGFHIGSGKHRKSWEKEWTPGPVDHRRHALTDMFARERAHRVEHKFWADKAQQPPANDQETAA